MCFQLWVLKFNLLTSLKLLSPYNKKGCCSTGCENKCCTDIFNEMFGAFLKKGSLFYDVDIHLEGVGREARTVLLLLLLSDVSKSVKYKFAEMFWFAIKKKKLLRRLLQMLTVLFTWYDITLWFCH